MNQLQKKLKELEKKIARIDSERLKGDNKSLSQARLWVRSLSLSYLCHLQGIGDRTVNEGQFCGTRAQSRRMEGVNIKITGKP